MDPKSLDFLFWHASSKLNNAQFEEALALFEFVAEQRPEDLAASIAYVYCKLRLRDLSGLESRLGSMLDRCQSDSQRNAVNRLRLRADWLRQTG